MKFDSPEQIRKNLSFLLVDESSRTNQILKSYLMPLGFNRSRMKMISNPDEGKSAIQYLESLIDGGGGGEYEIPDLFFLDWDGDFPVVRVVDRTRSLYSRYKRLGNMPIVVVTTERPRDQIVTAIQAGASTFLVKPMSGEQLEKKLAEVSKILLDSARSIEEELESYRDKLVLLAGEESRTFVEIWDKINHAIGLDLGNREAREFRDAFFQKYQQEMEELRNRNEREGDRLSDTGQFRLAKKRFAEAVKLYSKNPDSHLKLGMMYIKSTEYRYAVDCLRTSLENYPSNLETMALLGEAILRLAQETEDAELYAEAIGVLQDTVEKQEILTKRARSLRHLGDAHSAQGNGEQAIQCYTLSLELVSEQIGTLINLATALKSVGRVEEARKALGKAANLIPQDPHELIDLGRVWLERGEVEKAVQFIHRGMNHEKASQEDVCLYEKAIDALLEHGLVWEAAPLIDVVSKQRPDFYNALGMAFVKPKPVKGQLVEPRNRDFSQAIQAYTKALELDHTGDRYAYLHNRGMAYYKSDQIDLAELDFKQAYALNPNSATKKMLNTIKLDRKR